MSLRPVKQIIQTKPTIEGAGVKLQRAFGFGKTKEFDPFLLLDDFRNENPEDYLAGFPWHPHRGIETITYVLAGSVEHGDSLGNKGKMTAGDVQWMTAGSGILHQEMPKGDAQGRMHGFQLWANLPSSLKMTDPRYQDIPSSAIPEVTDDDGTRVRIICGEFWGKTRAGGRRGRRSELTSTSPFRRAQRKRLKVETTRNAFAYVFAGSGTFRDASDPRAVLTEQVANPDAPPVYDASNHSLVLFDRGDEIVVQAGPEGIRFLLVSGKPHRGAGRLVRSDRDEHAGTAPAGDEPNCRTATSSSIAESPPTPNSPAQVLHRAISAKSMASPSGVASQLF